MMLTGPGLAQVRGTAVSCSLEDATSPRGFGQAQRRAWVFRARKTSQAGKGALSCEDGAQRGYDQWFEANIKLL